MKTLMTILVTAFVIASNMAIAKELVRHVEIQNLDQSQPIQISATFYDRYLNYDSGRGTERLNCDVRFYSSSGPYPKNTGLHGDMATIGLAYLVDASTPAPNGWSAYNVIDEKGRTAKIMSYINPGTDSGRANQIDRVCWE